MKIILTFLWLVCLPVYSSVVQYARSVQYVFAENGLILHKQPGATSDKISLIPYGGQVTVLDNQIYGDSLTIRDILEYTYTGRWLHVAFKGQQGYVFDGWISHLPAPIRHKTQDSFSVDEQYFLIQLGTMGKRYNQKKYENCEHAPLPDCLCGYSQHIKGGVEYSFDACFDSYTETKVLLPDLTLHEGFLLWKSLLSSGEMSEYRLTQKKDSIHIGLKEAESGCDYTLEKKEAGLLLTYGCGC